MGRTDDYKRLYYEKYDESSSLSTIEGYFAVIVGFGLLVATCVHFQKGTHKENKRNVEMIKQSYKDHKLASDEIKLVASFALQRHSSPNHTQNAMGRSKMHLFNKEPHHSQYPAFLKRGTMFGLGKPLGAEDDDDNTFGSSSMDEVEDEDDVLNNTYE